MAEKSPNFPPIRACLFDMDGLLLNTEDLYTLVTNKVLEKYNRPKLPWSIKAQLQGRPGPEAMHIFQSWANLPMTLEEYFEESSALQRQYFPTAQPLPGASSLLDNLTSSKTHIALATSSQKRNFYLKTDHLKPFMSAFPEERRVLGDDVRIPPGKGKPAPDIYLLALDTINQTLPPGETKIAMEECLVFEDSVPGVEAGRRAGMRVAWVPHPELLKEFAGREEEVLAGLTSEAESETQALGQESGVVPEKALAGWPGQKGDGWAELLHSLEEFDYAKYGIKP